METLIRFIFLLILLTPYNNLLAKPITGNFVVLQVLDKITARISTMEIEVGAKAKYGSIEIEIFHCKKRPPEEVPEDFVLMRIIDEVSSNNFERVFQGWMLSSSPTIAPFEHPTYDVWVKDCRIETDSE
tara:strand:+ start:232 stop:618 length:387 start_codon:yes stop_codon:yes gene_type:complete